MADENERIIETVDEDGNVVKFELVDIVLVDENEYGIMIPVDSETNDDEAVIMRLKKVDDDFIFEYIDDDTEFENVVAAIEEMEDDDTDDGEE